MSSPPLSEPCHRARPFERPVPRSAGSRWPQALIQNPRAAPRKGLRLDDLVILSWPVVVRGEDLAVVLFTALDSLSPNAWPARPRPSFATPHFGFELTPRILQRAERRFCTRLSRPTMCT